MTLQEFIEQEKRNLDLYAYDYMKQHNNLLDRTTFPLDREIQDWFEDYVLWLGYDYDHYR